VARGAPSATAKCGGHGRSSLGSANGVGVVCVGVRAKLAHAFFLVAEPSATGDVWVTSATLQRCEARWPQGAFV
jgi:hypothetical protein